MEEKIKEGRRRGKVCFIGLGDGHFFIRSVMITLSKYDDLEPQDVKAKATRAKNNHRLEVILLKILIC